jgi:hypothetical protein
LCSAQQLGLCALAMSRVFVNAQAGREGKSGVKKEDEWGTTTSQAEFRGYEPAEMRNARDGPRHTKTALEGHHASHRGTQPKAKGGTYNWHRFQESFPDHSASAYTATEQSGSLPKLSATQGSRPKWADTHNNPIPHHSFDHVTHYSQHQLESQQARQAQFPYRDEFAPRSKRLLYEMAHQRVSRDSVASGSTVSASAFTMSSKARSGVSGASRSNSEGSLAASSHHTADSCRVVGGVARRRAQAQFRSPSLNIRDQHWLQEKWEKEGAAGLALGNFNKGFYGSSCRKSVDQLNSMKPLLGGYHEHEVVGK